MSHDLLLLHSCDHVELGNSALKNPTERALFSRATSSQIAASLVFLQKRPLPLATLGAVPWGQAPIYGVFVRVSEKSGLSTNLDLSLASGVRG